MKNLLLKILRLFKPVYQIVYTTADGRTEMYTISKPKHENEFGNYRQGLATAGFRAFCFNKGGVRSFRYDRIISLTRG